jgi:hypothetical protein
MTRQHRSQDEWAQAVEQAARDLLRGQGAGPEPDGYRVRVAACERHGEGCACVTYGMFREHLRWRVEDPHQVAGRAVRSMLPPRPEPVR